MSAQSIKDDIFPCTGGLNLVSPVVDLRPGTVQACYNWEPNPTNDGYREIGGCERFDGRTLASEAADPEAQRALITAVPGSGPVRGVAIFNGEVYAFRDSADGLTCKLYQATATGWDEMDLGGYIEFTAGTATFEEGETVTGSSSGATGIVGQIALDSGGWTTSDAAGKLWIHSITGTFQAETITSATGSATCAGAQTLTSLAPAGKYRFIQSNFYATAPKASLYGTDGKNKAFGWNGSQFVQITTGMDDDTPDLLAAHKGRLFVGFSEGSVQYSGINNPISTYSALEGAGEFGIGDWLTNIAPVQSDVLGIYGERVIYLLYGSASSDFELKPHSYNTGALTDTLQTVSDQLFLDHEGIRSLSATDAYGDFASNTVSTPIKPWLDYHKPYLLGSMVVRNKNQYRLFYTDPIETGSTLCMTASVVYQTHDSGNEQRLFQYLPARYPFNFSCFQQGMIDGVEWLFAGTDTGYVMKLDSGDSFDGAAIPSMIRLAWNHEGSPGVRKRFREVRFETRSDVLRDMTFTYEMNYADSHFPRPTPSTLSFKPDPGFWGVDLWGGMTWGGFPRSRFKLVGSGTNIALVLTGSRNGDSPVEINAVRMRYEIRRRY